MSSYRGKRFVNPLSKKIGRRTGKNFLAGKNIRLKDDGFENYDDYFSESDMDITKEVSRLHGVSEESESNDSQESKENHRHPSMSNILTGSGSSTMLDSKADSRYHNSLSQSVPNTTYNSTFGHSTLSQLDQGGRPIGTKFGWLRNKKIGRRTGKDVTANKQIRVDEDGFENFDDYMSESDVSTVSSRLSVSMRSGRRSFHYASIRSSLAQSEVHSQEEEYTTDDINSEESPGVELSYVDAESQKNVAEDDDGVESENLDEEDPDPVELSKTNKSLVEQSEFSGIENREGDRNTGVVSKSMLYSRTSSNHTAADGRRESKDITNAQSVTAEQEEGNSEENEETESDEEDATKMTETGDSSMQNDETEETAVKDNDSHKTKISHSRNSSKSSSRNATNNVDTEIHERTDPEEDCVDADSVDDFNSHSNVDNNNYHKSQSGTNIDVAGNLSGSITRLEAPASVVSFDRTRKRLSYSALEKSDESIQKHRKRIEEANEELKKREEPFSEPSKVAGEFHVISSVSGDTVNHTDKNTDDNDFMCLSSRPSKLYTSDKNVEESDDESDDDILIMDDVKKTFTAHEQVNKSKNKLPGEKRISNSMTGKDDLRSEKSRLVKSETKKRKSTKVSKNRRKTTHDNIKELNENSQTIITKSVRGKRQARSKHDSKNIVNEEVQLEINEVEVSHPDEQAVETDNDNFSPDDHAIIENEDHDDENHLKTSENKSVDKSRTKGRNKRISTNSSKKLSKTMSDKKKESVNRGKRKGQKYSNSDVNTDVNDECSAFESSKEVSKDGVLTKSKNKSRTIKRKSSSDDVPDSSPKVLKKLKANVVSKRSRKSTKSQSTSSEDDHQQAVSNPATPVPETLSCSTHFGSGVSFRVSRRSELLENVGSGYIGDVNVQMEPTETLTPCITRPGTSKRKQGRRVTLCPEENTEHEFIAEKYSSDNDVHPTTYKFRHSYGIGDETPLPSPNSTPVHIHEVTNTRSPNSEDDSDQIIVDRLIIPSPPVDGLRRSQRTRLKPVEWYKNEQVVFDYRRRSGPAIIGVKPSLEVEWKKVEEQKRKRRLLRNQIRKASLRTNKDKSKRKLSIHVDLPDDISVEENLVQEITVYNQFSEMEDGIDCVAKKDASQPVGPNYGTPKKDDPYVIIRLLSHPCVSAGKLCIHPNAEKPEHLVTADYVMFNIEYGKVLVKIHQTSVLLETGDVFMVPSGNTYSIQNLRTDNATLNYSIHKQVEQNDNSDDGRSLHEENL